MYLSYQKSSSETGYQYSKKLYISQYEDRQAHRITVLARALIT
jgi:hypothetical protein